MLESSKFDKFDKVAQWLDNLDTFEFSQHQKNSHTDTAANQQQNTATRNSQSKIDDFFDSDSSVNTGMRTIQFNCKASHL